MPHIWLLAIVAIALLLAYSKAIVFMVGQWGVEENSHGYLMPLVAGYLLWQRRELLRQMEFTGSWVGFWLVVVGLVIDAAGRLAALYVIEHIALLITIIGLVLAISGRRAFSVFGAPLAVLCFMIPIPILLLNVLSDQLQLLSSNIAVAMLRAINVAVFLEGNVIDLGGYKLEVAQACSGLRYLLPLMILALLMACFYRGSFLKRAILFASSVPITVFMNSFRVALIGLMVDRWGPSMAQGLIHEVQGWMMFMISGAILVLEAWLLARIGGSGRPLRELFSANVAIPDWSGEQSRPRRWSLPLVGSGVLIAIYSMVALLTPAAINAAPVRRNFETFPMSVGAWSGERRSLESEYLYTLKLDDYLLADFGGPGQVPINLYIAWYDAQRAGDATHSPKACLPGGGWHIQDLRQVTVPGATVGGRAVVANRVLIQYEDQRELVYYWFQQRGRVVSSEYLVKWYLLVDSLKRHRTDGALVRFVVPIEVGMTEQQADDAASRFIGLVSPQIDQFVPD